MSTTIRCGAAWGALLLASAWMADPRWEEASQMARAPLDHARCTLRRFQLAADGRSIWAVWLPEQFQNLDLQTGRVLMDVPRSRALTCHSLVHASGAFFVSLNWDHEFVRQSLMTAGESQPIPASPSESVAVFALHPRADSLAVANSDWLEIVPLDGSDAALLATPIDRHAVALAWSPDGKQLAVVDQDSNMLVRDGETLREIRRVPSRLCVTHVVNWSADGRAVIAYGNSGPVVVWPIDGEPRHLDFGVRHAAALSPDGTQLAICDPQGALWLVCVTDPDDRVVLGTLPSLATALQFSADGEHLVVGTHHGEIACWSTSEGRWLWAREPPQS